MAAVLWIGLADGRVPLWLLATGGSALGLLIFVPDIEDIDRVGVPPVNLFLSGLAFIAFSGSLFVAAGVGNWGAPVIVRLVVVATGTQVLLLGIMAQVPTTWTKERVAIAALDHVLVGIASLLALDLLPFAVDRRSALLIYVAAFAYLGLVTLWSSQVRPSIIPPRPATPARFWESIAILTALLGALAALVVTYTTPPTVGLEMTGPIRRPAATTASLTAVGWFSLLSSPDSVSKPHRWITGPLATIGQHAAFVILMLNVLFLGVFLAFPVTSPVILAIFLTVLCLAVAVEYGGVLWERFRPHSSPDDENVPPDPPVTVVIAAYNEATTLPTSLEHNLAKLSNVPFILVPAEDSTDGTIGIADQFAADYPERVTVIEGTTGTKGTDLNQAWDHVETPYTIVLDADERVDEEFLSHGLEVLESRPRVGVVQGRKAAIQPLSSRLNRFVTTERRQSTLLDQPFLEEVFKAGHFAGSAAIFRTEVPSSVGGWRPTYTEDIDITVRIDLETDWLVDVVPEMIVYEAQPMNLRALIAQRQRWSRGWAEVTVRYLRDIFRSRQRFGLRRTFGLIWILFISISSPIFVLFPALMAVRGLSFGLSPAMGVVLALSILPARGISSLYAALRDPVNPVPPNPVRILEVIVFAYMWIPAGWVIQTHSLFLQLAQADISWQTTQKQSPGPMDEPPS